MFQICRPVPQKVLWFALAATILLTPGSGVFCCLQPSALAEHKQPSTSEEGPKPYVYVTLGGPEDGGDFGPKTPGTKTGGIQEALDYAHKHHRDVYVWGGRCGVYQGKPDCGGVYELQETLEIPWNQDFRMDGGHYILNYSRKTGDAVVIDSQMNCRYKLGLIVSASSGAGVRIAPRTPGPDDITVVEASEFEFAAVCSRGTGIVLSATEGPIVNSRIFAEETNTGKRAVFLTGTRGIINNSIEVMYNNQYHAIAPCTCLQVGDVDSKNIHHNRFQMSVYAPVGLYLDPATKQFAILEDSEIYKETTGARIFAQNNQFSLSFYGRERTPGTDIVFEASAKDNTVRASNLPNGITNHATTPTNRVVLSNPAGFSVNTPSFPASGETVVNRSSYPVDIFILSAGEVREWTIADAEGNSQTLRAGLTSGQTFRLEPADSVAFTYQKRPAWRWKAVH